MKKLLLLLLCVLFASNILLSQTTTLEFKRVALVTSLPQTVPNSHVWKVENILPTTRLAVANTTWDLTIGETNLDKIIAVNGENIIVHSSSSTTKVQSQESGTTSSIRSSNSGFGFSWGILSGPIWLPEGTILAASTGVYAISVLEFKILP